MNPHRPKTPGEALHECRQSSAEFPIKWHEAHPRAQITYEHEARAVIRWFCEEVTEGALTVSYAEVGAADDWLLASFKELRRKYTEEPK